MYYVYYEYVSCMTVWARKFNFKPQNYKNISLKELQYLSFKIAQNIIIFFKIKMHFWKFEICFHNILFFLNFWRNNAFALKCILSKLDDLYVKFDVP